eukprot:359543-Chlamydomonas_euryale.AAC.1
MADPETNERMHARPLHDNAHVCPPITHPPVRLHSTARCPALMSHESQGVKLVQWCGICRHSCHPRS